jgi:hypothetical protein
MKKLLKLTIRLKLQIFATIERDEKLMENKKKKGIHENNEIENVIENKEMTEQEKSYYRILLAENKIKKS